MDRVQVLTLRIDPVGKGRVEYFNFPAGEPPGAIRPEIVLVRPNETSISDFFSGKFWENLGVLTLASRLEEEGVPFGVLEASLFQCTPAKTIVLATEHAPRFIGISVFSTDMLATCLDLADGIKAAAPGCSVVLGGHGASFVHREILENHDAIDMVLRGEAEESLVELLRASEGDESRVPSLSFRSGREIRVNPGGPVRQNLDEAPPPHRFAREILNADPVLSRTPLMIVSSRGCFDRCAFCTITQFYGGSWRGRSARHVVDELEFMLSRYRKNSVHFWDDTFIGPGRRGRQRAMDIAGEIERRGLDLTFHVTTRPSDLTGEVVDALARAGLRSVFLGVESSEQSTLDYFGKHARVEHSKAAIDLLWSHGVHRILVGFILFHPQMSWAGFRSDLHYLESLPCAELMRIASRLAFHPGAAFWQQHREELGPDAYVKSYVPPLPNRDFEVLYRVCVLFFSHTTTLEPVLVCLEEEFLHDPEVLDFLAACRTRIFGFMARRARQVSREIQRGRNPKADIDRLADEIFTETMRVVAALRQRLGGEYFDLLQKAYILEGHERFLESPGHRTGDTGTSRANA